MGDDGKSTVIRKPGGGRSFPMLITFVALFCVVVTVPLSFVASTGEVTWRDSSGALSSILFLKSWVVWVADAEACVAAAFLFGVGLWNLHKKRQALGVLALFFGLAAGMVLVATFPARQLVRMVEWNSVAETTGPDGSRYSFLCLSWLGDVDCALARVRKDAFYGRNMRVLGMTSVDGRSHNGMLVIRPADAPDDKLAHLYWSQDGMLAGVVERNRCYFVFDATAGRFYQDDTLADLGPFVLIGASAELNASDLDAVVAAHMEANGGVDMSDAARATAVSHRNPRVREAAQRVLDAESRRKRP